MYQADCVFCKIVAGEIPSIRVFEDEACLAFLDIGPLAEGHLLVVPKTHYEVISDMPEAAVAAVTRQIPRLVKAVMQATGAAGCNVLQNNGQVSGQLVPHVHFHIIPRQEGDGLGYRWNATQYPAGRAQQVREAIVRVL